jgi:hypothetical protein
MNSPAPRDSADCSRTDTEPVSPGQLDYAGLEKRAAEQCVRVESKRLERSLDRTSDDTSEQVNGTHTPAPLGIHTTRGL